VTTTYIGGIYEKKVGPSSTVVTKYYAALGRRVAMRTRDAAMQGPAGTLTYLLADHLGSTVGLLDASGALVTGSRTSYWPYGSTRTGGSSLPDKAFTGQQKEASDDQLGLYDYGARFYSTVAGRFLSADPVVGRASDPQAWNAYTYVRSNPLRLTDPTGRCWEGQCPGEQDDCSATCHAWRELDRLGIHSQSDLDRYQDEQRKAQNWVNSGSIAEGGGADCDYGCQLRALARAFAGCSACASVDWGAWRHFMEAAANYDLAQGMIAGAAYAALAAAMWAAATTIGSGRAPQTAPNHHGGGLFGTGWGPDFDWGDVGDMAFDVSRAAANAPLTAGAVAFAETYSGADCSIDGDLFVTCTGAQRGAPKGGITIGNTFITKDTPAELSSFPAKLNHEKRHATQYFWFSPLQPFGYFAAYGVAEAVGGGPCGNFFERDAGLAAGGYQC